MTDTQAKLKEEGKKYFGQKYSFKVPEDWLM